ncbi:hypothetical protein SKAU_G00290670 [Synaphobranchus kaupii]|uniref:Uncharacterized protein n=1 Tax=Synaphobranchus kaupii TaxID=118154 RepID=A0A9Q1ETN3_SYNKA|nr:hypothetical protein SKAU_G00290670 [Synaphobranchus kaupii]
MKLDEEAIPVSFSPFSGKPLIGARIQVSCTQKNDCSAYASVDCKTGAGGLQAPDWTGVRMMSNEAEVTMPTEALLAMVSKVSIDTPLTPCRPAAGRWRLQGEAPSRLSHAPENAGGEVSVETPGRPDSRCSWAEEHLSADRV